MTEIRYFALPPFQVIESLDHDGTPRLALIGELDISGASRLSTRLDHYSRTGTRARVDLSGLVFMDLIGVRALMRAAHHRCEHDQQLLEFGTETAPIVRRVIDLVGAAPILWPTRHSFDGRAPYW